MVSACFLRKNDKNEEQKADTAYMYETCGHKIKKGKISMDGCIHIHLHYAKATRGREEKGGKNHPFENLVTAYRVRTLYITAVSGSGQNGGKGREVLRVRYSNIC